MPVRVRARACGCVGGFVREWVRGRGRMCTGVEVSARVWMSGHANAHRSSGIRTGARATGAPRGVRLRCGLARPEEGHTTHGHAGSHARDRALAAPQTWPVHMKMSPNVTSVMLVASLSVQPCVHATVIL